MDEAGFEKAVKSHKVPVLVLDQKWHRLFAISGKPEEVKALEVEINELLSRQGKLNSELKSLKKIKSDLMANVMEHMDGADGNAEATKKLDDDKRLLEETKERIDSDEDELLDIPNLIKDKNNELMMMTMRFSYDKLIKNSEEITQITDWIREIKDKLKKNIIRKQNREINNKEIYAYMHDVFGKDVINLFDGAFAKGKEIEMGGSPDEHAEIKAQVLAKD